MTGTEVVQGGQTLARNIPSALQAAGVQVVDDGAGRRGVIIPAELRQRANILEPISEIAAADPNWTPSVRLAELDAEQHSYNQQGKRALNKQGLEVLAELAGVIDMKTHRMGRDELADTEKFGWRAIIKIRRSDGTVKEITASKTWDEEIAREEVTNTLRGDTAEAKRRDFQKKWLAERQHASRKTETKATLAAIRGALKVPHVFTEAQFRKPFIVIGYSFTPDMSDPQTRDILIRHGLGAGAQVFGGAAAEVREPAELPAAPAGMNPVTGELPAAPPPLTPAPVDEGTQTPVGDPLPTGAPDPDVPPNTPDPDVPQPDAAPLSEAQPQPSAQVDQELYQRARAVVWPHGRQKGKSFGQILDEEPSYLHWIIGQDSVEAKFRRAAQILQEAHPDKVKGRGE